MCVCVCVFRGKGKGVCCDRGDTESMGEHWCVCLYGVVFVCCETAVLIYKWVPPLGPQWGPTSLRNFLIGITRSTSVCVGSR